MMSDVLAYVRAGCPLTGLCNPQVVRTAEMMDMVCIVFVRGKFPKEVVELAENPESFCSRQAKECMSHAECSIRTDCREVVSPMPDSINYRFEIDGDNFTSAGESSVKLKKILRGMGFSPEVVRRVSVAMYEGEINMVIHAHGGVADINIYLDRIEIILTDHGPGIKDVSLSMQEGYSNAPDTIRSLGFGAGMGLPNMKRYTDEMRIETEVGKGTKVFMTVRV